MSTEIREGFVETQSGKIHYIERPGKGKTLHFLHANGFCAGVYRPFFSHFDNDFHIIASDVRGHGDSDGPGTSRIVDWEVYARDLKEFLEKKTDLPIIGLGHSLGAVFTYMASSIFQELFSKIVMIDPVILPARYLMTLRFLSLLGQRSRVPIAKLARRRKKSFTDRQEALERFSSGRGMFKNWEDDYIESYLDYALVERDGAFVLKCDPEIEAQFFESVPANIYSYARHIQCPVLAIRCETSDTFVYEAEKRLVKKMPHCKVATIVGSGHFIPMEKPAECAGVIDEFIKAV